MTTNNSDLLDLINKEINNKVNKEIANKLAETPKPAPNPTLSPVGNGRVADGEPGGATSQSHVRTAHASKRPANKAVSNRINAAHSTGPRTPEGKARVSANALKTGFYAAIDHLNPHDSPAYQTALDDMRLGLHPDGPVEELLIRELAMLKARLGRLEATEYALLCSEIESDPGDIRQLAAAEINNAPHLERLQKAETHLRRAYNRTWDRLERMQKTRLKMPLDQALKQSQIWATHEAIRTSCPTCVANGSQPPPNIPQRHPTIDEKGKLIVYPKGHPMHRPKDDEE